MKNKIEVEFDRWVRVRVRVRDPVSSKCIKLGRAQRRFRLLPASYELCVHACMANNCQRRTPCSIR